MVMPKSSGTASLCGPRCGPICELPANEPFVDGPGNKPEGEGTDEKTGIHGLIPIRLRTAVWARPTMITSVAARAAAMNSADQICTV